MFICFYVLRLVPNGVLFSRYIFFIQVGGWTQVYGNIQLSFACVRGATPKVLVAQPARSLVLFKAFLVGKPLQEA